MVEGFKSETGKKRKKKRRAGRNEKSGQRIEDP